MSLFVLFGDEASLAVVKNKTVDPASCTIPVKSLQGCDIQNNALKATCHDLTGPTANSALSNRCFLVIVKVLVATFSL